MVRRQETHIHSLPFPCAVYVKTLSRRASCNSEYEFSHYCRTFIPKAFPQSLRVRDLQHSQTNPMAFHTLMRKACFLVLVAGDVAQCVSVENAQDSRQRTRFLFRGSCYASTERRPQCSEFHEDYIPLHFYATLASFKEGHLTSVSDLECGIALFPKCIREVDLQAISRWVDHNIGKSVHGSTWATNKSESYSEHTRAIRRQKKCEEIDGSDGPANSSAKGLRTHARTHGQIELA